MVTDVHHVFVLYGTILEGIKLLIKTQKEILWKNMVKLKSGAHNKNQAAYFY